MALLTSPGSMHVDDGIGTVATGQVPLGLSNPAQIVSA